MLRLLLAKITTPPTRRWAALLFFVPWLVVLAFPVLRWQLRVQALGSQYADENFCLPITLPALWLYPRDYAPTWKQLQNQAKKSAEWRTAVDLKAPRQRGDSEIEPVEMYRVSSDAVQRQPRNAFVLATRLRSALALVNSSSSAPSAPAGNAPNDNWRVYLWDSYDDTADFPAVTRRIWRDEEEEFDASIDVPRIARPTKITSQQALGEALKAAQRGGALEPDNAYWPWQESYLLLQLRRDNAAREALLRAAHSKKFDDHRRDDFQQTLQVAQAQRPLLIEEKLGLFSQQLFRDKAYPEREKLWLLRARRAERDGFNQRALVLSAALASVGALQNQTAHRAEEKHSALLLQCFAWMGDKRFPLRKLQKPQSAAPKNARQKSSRNRKTLTHYEVRHLQFLNSYPRLSPPVTPDLFAQRFAESARRAGRPDLAQAALQQGRAANRVAKELIAANKYNLYSPTTINLDPKFRFASALPDILIFKWAAQMTLVQLQITLAFWCLLNLILWQRLWFLGRFAARLWRFFSMLWRTRDKPLWDEEVPVLKQEQRDGARSFWFIGVFALPALFGLSYWNIMLAQWYPEVLRPAFNTTRVMVPTIACVLLYPTAPVLLGLFWCGGAALKRYYRLQLPRVWRDDIETTALHAPPSVIPLVSAFMVWSLTAFALLCWLGGVLAYYLPRGSFDFTLPALWASWLDTSSISLFSWPEEWAAFAAFFSLIALAAWLWKWGWQMHLRRRLPALYLGLSWWRQTLGAWLILASWLYLILLLLALPTQRTLEAQFAPMANANAQHQKPL